MKKLIALSVISLVLSGCVNPGKASVQPDQLKSHRFVLENVDGKAVKGMTTQPEIAFNALPDISLINNISVSGEMCNRFNGQGKLSEGELKVKTLAMTRKLCTEPQLERAGSGHRRHAAQRAQVDLTEDQLTLATADKTLMFKRAE